MTNFLSMKRAFSFIVLSLLLLNPLQAAQKFDTDPWHRVLLMVVSTDGFVNYDWLRNDPKDLDLFLAQASKVSPHSHPDLFPTREDQLVYWLQVYNAFALRNVLNFPGLKKISDKKRKFFVKTKIEIGGKKYSLQSLENDLIRPEFKDARVHFFLNCAAWSCPKLYREPLEPKRLDKQLDQYSKNFVNDPQHVRFDKEEGILYLSKILKWYRVDFLKAMKEMDGGKKEKIIAYLNKYRKVKIPTEEVRKIKYIPYDWTVNDINNL